MGDNKYQLFAVGIAHRENAIKRIQASAAVTAQTAGFESANHEEFPNVTSRCRSLFGQLLPIIHSRAVMRAGFRWLLFLLALPAHNMDDRFADSRW